MSRNCATSLYVIIMDYCGMDAQGLWKVNENNPDILTQLVPWLMYLFIQ